MRTQNIDKIAYVGIFCAKFCYCRLAAFAPFCKFRKNGFGIAFYKVKVLFRFAPVTSYRICDKVLVAGVVFLEAETVGNCEVFFNLFVYPVFACCFENVGVGIVGNKKRVVIKKLFRVTAVSALQVFGEQIYKIIESFFCGAASFKSKAEHIHAGNAVAFKIFFAREHRFVADIQSELVKSEFGAPHPGRAGYRDFVGMGNLRYGNIGKFK